LDDFNAFLSADYKNVPSATIFFEKTTFVMSDKIWKCETHKYLASRMACVQL